MTKPKNRGPGVATSPGANAETSSSTTSAAGVGASRHGAVHARAQGGRIDGGTNGRLGQS